MIDPLPLTADGLAAFDLVPGAIWVFSADDMTLLFANAAACTLLRRDSADLCGLSIRDVVGPDLHARVADTIAGTVAPGDDPQGWTFCAADGALHDVRVSLRRASLEGAPVLVALAHADGDGKGTVRPDGTPGSADGTGGLPQGFERLFAALPGNAMMLGPDDFRIIAVTDDYAAMVQMDRTALVGRRFRDVFPGNSDDPPGDGANALAQSFERVVRMRTTDLIGVVRWPGSVDGPMQGDRIWLPITKPVLDADGRVTCILHRIEDVTEAYNDPAAAGMDAQAAPGADAARKSAGLQGITAALWSLRERDLRLRIAENLLGLGAWEYDFQTGAMSWSPRVFEIYGRQPEDGQPDFESYVAFTHPDDREQMLAAYDAFLKDEGSDLVFRHRVYRSDGGLAHVKGVGRRHKVQGRDILVGFVLDETGAAQLQAELSVATRLQRLAGRMARLGSWRYDVGADDLYWGKQTARIHQEAEGFQPTVEQGIGYYVPEHRELIRAAFFACLETGEPFDHILQMITARNNLVWVRAIGEAVRDGAGKIVAVEGAFQDISELIAERGRTQTQARRLRDTLEHISDAFYLLDHDWRFAFLNGEAEKLLRRGRDELLGKVVWDEFPASVGSAFETAYRNAMSGGNHVRLKEFFAPLETWFEVDAFPTPEGLAVYFRDVTQTRARDERLHLLAAAVSRQNDIVLITEAEPIDAPDGPKIVYVNEAFTRRTGYTAEEVLGKTPRILQGPKTQRAELDRIRTALRRWQPVRSELINYTKSGEEFWLELDIVPLADDGGRFTHWVAIERDITERREAEAAMRASEDRFRLVARATGNAIWDWDIVSDRHWWSEGLTDQFGHARDLEGSIPTIWEDNVHPEDRERVLAGQARMLNGNADAFHEVYRFRCADGSWATVDDHAFVIRDADGRAIRLLGSMNDVTEKVQLEERLRQSQKLEAVGQLTGGVAHDFNNLLTVILGNAETLVEELRGDEQLRMLAAMMSKAAERGAELTARLLAFSRRQPLEPRVLDLNAMLRGMEHLLRRTLGEQIDIEIVQAGGLWLTEVDASQLEAAILNLAINARDAMPDGGALTIETANAALDQDYVSTDNEVEPGQYVVVIVTDTGHGMSPDVAARVFEPFYTTKDIGKGSGLGLSMVFGFVKQSGGHIRIYSEPGEGTAIKLYFRRSIQPGGAFGPLSIKNTRLVGGSETILVVEDEALVREHLTLQLQALGYTVISAANGPQALEVLAKRTDIDLLFTDVVMPGGLNGRDVAEIARRTRPDLKVLYTSGYTENSIVHQGRLDPGVDLLTKPYRRDRLAAKVRKVLDGP